MRIKSNLEFQTYNDGLCSIYSVENDAQKGNLPKKKLVSKYGKVPYEKRTVGVKRFYIAKQADVTIELLIRVPDAFKVSPQDVCMINGKQYTVHQVQDIMDSMPESKDLTLKKTEEVYEFARV